jgi:hypothetical protein
MMEEEMHTAEEDYARYQELQRSVEAKREELNRLIAEFRPNEEMLKVFITEVNARITKELIAQASKEYQLHLIRLIQDAVEAGDLKEAVARMGQFERHLESVMGEYKKREEPIPKAPELRIGRVNERVARFQGNVLEICRLEYDEADRLIQELYYSPHSQLMRIRRFEYDDLGRVAKKSDQGPGGRIIEVRELIYGEQGSLEKELSRDEAGAIQWECRYEYDKAGRVVRLKWLDPNSKITKLWEYRYDDEPRPRSVIWRDSRGKVFGYCEYSYDAAGQLSSEVTRDRRGDILRVVEYEYRC